MAEVQWFYARNDQQLGPVSAAELRQLASGGSLSPEDLVWREGWEEWAPASRLKGLFQEPPKPGLEETRAMPAFSPDEAPSIPPAIEPPPAAITPGPMFVGLGSEAPPVALSTPIAPPAAPLAPTSAPAVAADRSASISNSTGATMLLLVQATLWGTCVLVVLLGAVAFFVSLGKADEPAKEAAAGVVFGAYALAAYIVARAGEKISRLINDFLNSGR